MVESDRVTTLLPAGGRSLGTVPENQCAREDNKKYRESTLLLDEARSDKFKNQCDFFIFLLLIYIEYSKKPPLYEVAFCL